MEYFREITVQGMGIAITESICSYSYDEFMFKDPKPRIQRKSTLKRHLHKWRIKEKWVKFG